MKAPIDSAALVILRALLADLEAGRAVVVSMTAEDDQERAIAFRWREAGANDEADAPYAQEAPSSTPEPPQPVPGPIVKRCRECGHGPLMQGQHGDVCVRCGAIY